MASISIVAALIVSLPVALIVIAPLPLSILKWLPLSSSHGDAVVVDQDLLAVLERELDDALRAVVEQ